MGRSYFYGDQELVYAIVTHTDIDGVASAALYLYLNGVSEYRVFFTEPFLLHKTLDKVATAYYEKVAILDLGINAKIYEEVLDYIALLRKHGIPVEWFDHHIWEQKWVEDFTSLGVELYIDTSTCTAGVVAKYSRPTRADFDKGFVENVVKGVCSGDLWRFDHWLGGFYIRLVRRRDKDSWRKAVLKTLAQGVYWSSEFNEKVEEHIDKELNYLSSRLNLIKGTVRGVKLVIAESGELVENSFIAAYIMGRYNADVVVLVSSDGKLSFRSRNFDVRSIAYRLGGGGHKFASGAKIDIPWWVSFLSRAKRDILLRYVFKLVAREVEGLA